MHRPGLTLRGCPADVGRFAAELRHLHLGAPEPARAVLAELHAAAAAAKGVLWLDAGVSGGVWGLEEGYNMMVGGDEAAYRLVEPALTSLAPPGGLLHVGPAGSGHFVKTIHNGIEYGLLQAYAEGFEALSTFPHAQLDLAAISELWTNGSVVRSWLLDLLALALKDEPRLDNIEGYVDDSGTGRWTVEYGVEHAVPMPAISAAPCAKQFISRMRWCAGSRSSSPA